LAILRGIIKKEGVLALYSGLSAALIGTVCSYGIFFYWFRYLKNKFFMMTGRKEISKIEMTIITAISGTLSSVIANPVWMINARMAINKK